MSSIGSPTPLSSPKIDDKIIKSQLGWVDCHYTRKCDGRCLIHTKYQQQPGKAEKCGNGCKPAIVAWPPLSKRILLNPQSLPNRARTSNSKVAIVFLVNWWECWAWQSSWETFSSEVTCCCCTLYLIVPHIIKLDVCTLALVNKNDESDCIEMNSVVGVDQLVEKRDPVHMCLGKWP